MTRVSQTGLVAVLGLCLAVSLACGGDDDDDASPTPVDSGPPPDALILYRDSVGFVVAQDLATGESSGHAVDFNEEVVVSAACSPAGDRIAFLRQYFDRRTRTLEIRGGAESLEIELPSTTQGFDWSPDGSQIVFTEFDGFANTHKVSILDLATGETTELTSGGAIAGSPAWSPDGDVIAFDIQDILSTHAEIYLIDPGGGDPEQIEVAGDGQWRDPTWAPDGRLLVAGYREGVQELYLIPAEGGEAEPLTNSPDIFKGSPKYSPDGEGLAYTGSIILEQLSVQVLKLHSFGIFLLNPDGTNERALTADPRLNPGAAVDPYLDAYLLGWCVPGPWLDDSWESIAATPTPEGLGQ